MASSSASSSTSSKRGYSPGRHHPIVKQDKKILSVDDFRYLATGLTNPARKMVKTKPHNSSNGEVVAVEKLEQSPKDMSTLKKDMEVTTMKNLAKEMGRMLVHAKSRGHTNELLQLFKSTLNNFVTDKHQIPTSSKEGSTLKPRNQSNKRIVKSHPQIKEQPVQGHQKTAVTHASKPHAPPPMPPTPSETKHNKQSSKASGEFTLMSDRERSVITTTTVTRTKIREPIISVIESSKTNVLHRCYGKQSMKVLPPVHKSTKKSNPTVGNNQRPTPAKVRTPTKASLPPKPTTNHQMKTIYENEQYDKLNSSHKLSSNSVEKATSSGSVELPEQLFPVVIHLPNIDTENTNNELIPQKQIQMNEDSRLQPTKSFSSENSNTPQEIINECKTLQPYNSEQDNSLVQRLTSFWNKKLNASEKTTSSDISSATSSTTYIINVNSDNSLGKRSVSDKVSEEILSDSFDINNENFNISTAQNRVQDVKEELLPDIKDGLVDELIGVLKSKRELPFTKNANNFCSEINKKQTDRNKNDKQGSKVSLVNSNDTFSNISSDGYNDCTDEEIEEEFSSEETAAVDEDVEDSDEDIISPRYNEEGGEETIEAIQTCLMQRITVRNFNKNKYHNNNKDVLPSISSHSSFIKYNEENDNEDEKKSENKKLLDDKEKECCVDDKLPEKTEPIQCEIDKTIQTEESAEKKDFGANCQVNSLTTKNDKIALTILNVNDVIMNLRNLIFAIETIPEELKGMSVDLNSLPIPDKIKQTLSLILDKDINKAQEMENKLLSSSTDFKTTHLERLPLSLIFSEGIYYDNLNNRRFGCCTREGLLKTCYFPSTLTIPILESVVNLIHPILFPKHNDYLKSKLKPIANFASQDLFTEDHCKLINSENTYKPINGDNQKYKTRVVTKSPLPHFTVFYGTVAPNKLICAQGTPALSFQSQTEVKVNATQKDVTGKFTKENELDSTKETYTVGLMCMNADSGNSHDSWQKNSSVKIICENDTKTDVGESHINKNICSSSCQENDCQSSGAGNSVRRRRLWRQSHLEEDNIVQSGGGGGDFNIISQFPSYPTSSTSLMVSSSVNSESGSSQLDPNQVESDRGDQRPWIGYLSSLSRSQVDMDIMSCDVIQEMCEKCSSEIDDCLMVGQHQNQEIKKEKGSKTNPCEDSKQKANKTSIENVDEKNVSIKDNDDHHIMVTTECLQEHRATSTSDLEITTVSKRDVGTMVTYPDLSSKNYYNNSIKEEKNFARKSCDRDYILLCCKSTAPKRIQVLEQNMIHKKYDLEVLFSKNPMLKQELSNVIDIDNLCNKEKQLIAVCLMLLKGNNFAFENSLLRFLLQSVEKGASSLWNKTSKRFSSKINKAKKRLIGKCQSQTLLGCHYRKLIKVLYTTLISMMLCFVIQKHFCGMSLPIRFPW